MSYRKRIASGLLLVCLLALLQPVQADAGFRPGGGCLPDVCADTSAGVRSHAPFLAAAGQHARLFSESTRQTGYLSFRFTTGISYASLDAASALCASGWAACLEHRDVVHPSRAAGPGFLARAPRSPPVPA